MVTPEQLAEARGILGRQLAEWRDAAGLTQARLSGYTRSAIANVETGRSSQPHSSWRRYDELMSELLSAEGALLAAYDHYAALAGQYRQQAAAERERQRTAKLEQWHGTHTTVVLTDTVWGRSAGGADDGARKATGVDAPAELDGQLAGFGMETPGAASSQRTAPPAWILGHPSLPVASGRVGQLGAIRRRAFSHGRLSPLEVEEILAHLREQWHALVRADNLLGPSHALGGVSDQLTVLVDLMPVVRGRAREEVVRLAARYAESAAWLYEDAGDLAHARRWTAQAMEWSYEANDPAMLAWTAYRRSQQAQAVGEADRTVALARAARRDEAELATPMRAAAQVQEARGHAMVGDERSALQLLDGAHSWAADDTAGEARSGHGSFCTPSYIEINRAVCLALLGHPREAIACYERALPGLPAVYRRDRAAALAGKAAAHAAVGEADDATAAAHTALLVARRAGSRRIVDQVATVGRQLARHREVPAVAALLDDLAGRTDG